MNFSRREFLKLFPKGLLAFSLSPLSFFESFATSFNPLELIKLIDFSCLKCSFKGICIKWDDGELKIGVRISYWVPVGFAETGRAFEFGASHRALGFLTPLFKPIVDSLSPFVPKGGKTTTFIRGNEVYFKLYPHYLGWGNFILSALAQALVSVISKQPWCVCGVLENALKRRVFNVPLKVKEIYEKLNLSKYLDYLQKFEGFYSILNPLPFFASEFVFPIWIIDTLSPDTRTFLPFIDSVVETLTRTSTSAGILACPYLIEALFKHHVRFPAGLDPSFICVGHWGFGYPRTGIVYHPDPVVAGLLSIARFLHLFSRTFPVINLSYSNQTVKFQMFNPHKTGCFRPGYYISDPIAKPLVEIPSRLMENPLDEIKSLKREIETPNLYLKSPPLRSNYRNVGVVVWKYYSHCCF